MAAANPYISLRDIDNKVMGGITNANIFTNSPDRVMYTAPNAVIWNDANASLREPATLAEAGYFVKAGGPVNGGGPEAYIEVEIFYTVIPTFDATYDGTQ